MIECNPYINFGQPALKGRRLTVYDIVTKVYYENGIEIAAEDYSISIADINDALEYCKALKCKSDVNRVQYCDGCVLRSIEDGGQFESNKFLEFQNDGKKFVTSLDGKIIFSGTLKEFEESENGRETWLIAEGIINKLGKDDVLK